MCESNEFVTSEEAAEILDLWHEEAYHLPIRWYEGPDHEISYLASDVEWLKEQGWRPVSSSEEDLDDPVAECWNGREPDDDPVQLRVRGDGEGEAYDDLTELYWQLHADAQPGRAIDTDEARREVGTANIGQADQM